RSQCRADRTGVSRLDRAWSAAGERRGAGDGFARRNLDASVSSGGPLFAGGFYSRLAGAVARGRGRCGADSGHAVRSAGQRSPSGEGGVGIRGGAGIVSGRGVVELSLNSSGPVRIRERERLRE